MSKLYWQLGKNNFLFYVIIFKKYQKYLCKTATQTKIICFQYRLTFITKIKIVYITKNYKTIQDSQLYNIINLTEYKINLMLYIDYIIISIIKFI